MKQTPNHFGVKSAFDLVQYFSSTLTALLINCCKMHENFTHESKLTHKANDTVLKGKNHKFSK